LLNSWKVGSPDYVGGRRRAGGAELRKAVTGKKGKGI